MATSLFGDINTGSPAQPEFSFPEPLTERYRPHAIDDFVGLDKVKNIMRKLAANPFPSAWLFVGPSGTGKTTMVLALAEAIPAEIHHIPSQNCNLETIERVRRTCQYVPMAGCRFHIVIVDEADRMTPAARVALLSKLDSTDSAPNTVWIFTCNATDTLEPRFLSRCRVLEFSSYGIAKDAAVLLEKIWKAESGSDLQPNFARIVKDSANNIRAALQSLELELMAA
jgi:replication-associated recombination protein RarA